MRCPLVIGNWKLNGNKRIVSDLITIMRNELRSIVNCNVAIAPPMIYLALAKSYLEGSQIALGAQNVDIHLSGAYTGEISAEMLKDIGAKYIIIGHSERRTYHKESDEFIVKKFAILKTVDLIPVLCIGENEAENKSGQTEAICAFQIDAILDNLGIKAFENTVIAYEPIWAIGTGKSAEPEQVQKVHKFIRSHIAKYNSAISKQIIIQYGGSVNITNVAEFLVQADIDGVLVGGASLKAEVFAEIVKIAATVKAKQV
ncbi:Triosephosphate isomerase [Candidatus Gullanella endobia]|uniref:Triosephosphate isomerase n=1 Tax=Candidatus Gullanella endobia TaxID=1070130 RepID=A0A143WR59_9ENTR|nr:triose-phosphate isomerase [Candidatus Gullanella endobia]CUX96234.1 Triosephosphate isomerase [Candidatus Gullanella endobia]